MDYEVCASAVPLHPRAKGKGKSVAKRTQEFIHEHYREQLHMEDLCLAAGVRTRTLQRCFRAHLGVTITDYLKTMRLDAARSDLIAADPSQDSVTDIALRHGFGHLGRFSVTFRERFNERPRETLAKTGQKSFKANRERLLQAPASTYSLDRVLSVVNRA